MLSSEEAAKISSKALRLHVGVNERLKSSANKEGEIGNRLLQDTEDVCFPLQTST